MLCQICQKKQATTHIKSILNGEVTEYDLCPECAKKMGYGNIFADMSSDFSSLLGSFFGMGKEQVLPSSKRCPTCGSSFSDIARSGKVGCADCYSVFYEKLLPTIRRIHGNTEHIGKAAESAGEQNRIQNEVEELKSQLQKAIDAQEFEKAAELRDKIKELEDNT